MVDEKLKLQSIKNNLNPSFDGKIDIENDLYAFIDESGDDGFDFSKHGVSKWFNVSALITSPTTAQNMIDEIVQFNKNRDSKRLLAKMSSKELNHVQKKGIFLTLQKFDFITIHSLFYKQKIDPNNGLIVYPSMFFVGIKNVIERITWCTKQSGKNRTHILISGRNDINAMKLGDYLFKKSFLANKNLCYIEKLGKVGLSTINKHNTLLLADYSAYSLRMVFENIGNPPAPEPYYFDMFQRGKLYCSDHPKYSGVWSNGLKLTPADKELIKNNDILNEGSRKL